jgi:hypothetical protein
MALLLSYISDAIRENQLPQFVAVERRRSAAAKARSLDTLESSFADALKTIPP